MLNIEKFTRWLGRWPMKSYADSRLSTGYPEIVGQIDPREPFMRPNTATTQIRFDFSPKKALQAMGYLVGRLQGIDKVALTKLLYIVDREHFLSAGYPITGDSQKALPHGPLSSQSLSLLDGEFDVDEKYDIHYFFMQDGHRLSVCNDPGIDALDCAEKETLDQVLRQYGDIAKRDKWAFVDQTHEFPEFKDVFRPNTSTLIPYELILKHHAPDRMLHGRPVISEAIASRMVNPFWCDDSDL